MHSSSPVSDHEQELAVWKKLPGGAGVVEVAVVEVVGVKDVAPEVLEVAILVKEAEVLEVADGVVEVVVI